MTFDGDVNTEAAAFVSEAFADAAIETPNIVNLEIKLVFRGSLFLVDVTLPSICFLNLDLKSSVKPM